MLRWTVCFIYAVMVAIASVIPISARAARAAGWLRRVPCYDKLIHFLLYGLLALLLAWALGLRIKTLRWFAVPVLIASLYGALMELVQGGLGYRSFSVADMAANTAGALFFVALYEWRMRRAGG